MADTDLAQGGTLRRIRTGLWLVVVAVLIGGASLAIYSSWSDAGKSGGSGFANFGGPFTLTAPDGSTVTEKTLAGKPYAIFFGFTRCPDVCPTSLSRMAKLRKALGKDGMKFNIVFVSVDPEHDKAADVGSYVELFGTPIIGLTGTPDQLAQIEKGYGVYVRRIPIDPANPKGDFTIDHTASVYLIGSDGEFVTTIDHHEADELALAKLKRLIG